MYYMLVHVPDSEGLMDTFLFAQLKCGSHLLCPCCSSEASLQFRGCDHVWPHGVRVSGRATVTSTSSARVASTHRPLLTVRGTLYQREQRAILKPLVTSDLR